MEGGVKLWGCPFSLSRGGRGEGPRLLPAPVPGPPQPSCSCPALPDARKSRQELLRGGGGAGGEASQSQIPGTESEKQTQTPNRCSRGAGGCADPSLAGKRPRGPRPGTVTGAAGGARWGGGGGTVVQETKKRAEGGGTCGEGPSGFTSAAAWDSDGSSHGGGRGWGPGVRVPPSPPPGSKRFTGSWCVHRTPTPGGLRRGG